MHPSARIIVHPLYAIRARLLSDAPLTHWFDVFNQHNGKTKWLHEVLAAPHTVHAATCRDRNAIPVASQHETVAALAIQACAEY